jgi:lysine 2,3-aminomutase
MSLGPIRESRNLYPHIRREEQMDWRWQLEHLIRTEEELLGCLDLPPARLSNDRREGEPPPLWVTPYYAGLIRPGDRQDPILRQVLPLPEEQEGAPHASPDPLAEEAHSPVKGLIHRYPDRALLLVTGFCPTLCRFCFRKRGWNPDPVHAGFNLSDVVDYLRSHEEIHDVILSGGDPLTVPLARLDEILGSLRRIPHIRILRIGTRVPATLPMAIDGALTAVLKNYRPLWLMTHFNHPREVTREAAKGLDRLTGAGISINNQSVLLKGVNDEVQTLIRLSQRLLEKGVRPYYLHQVDAALGVKHFRVPLERGMEIISAMFGRISGMGIPRYTLDRPGGKGKVPLMPSFCEEGKEGEWIFRSPLGGRIEIPVDNSSLDREYFPC